LSDGNHTIKVAVEDAAGNMTTVYGPVTKLIANHPPVNTARPGDPNGFTAPATGEVLRFANGGEWSGPNLNMAYAWLRCDQSGGACEQIPGAMGLSYLPTPDDVGHTLKLAVTATNVADSVTVYSAKSGVVAAAKRVEDTTAPSAMPVVTIPGLSTVTNTTTNTTIEREHVMIGRIVGEPAGATCPADKATLKFQHISGGRLSLRYGRATTAQVLLTCTNSGKPIAGAKLEIATKTGTAAAVASDVTTDGAGHATLRIGKGASRGIAIGYRMYADDPMARATASLRVFVTGKVSLKANRSRLRNGRAVTLRGAVAGGNVPGRGVTLAVQWKDGRKWRPFAQIKTNKHGRFTYAYRFTRTNRTVRYQLRVQVTKGQVDYPFVASASKAVKVTVAP
jgi:5-hydroxyisourate hydrolase-like protein (transthyretin family)